MAIANPLTITYGGREVGGESAYQIHGPHAIDKRYSSLRISFDIVVVATSFETLESLSTAIETDFRKRLTTGETLVLDIDGTEITYTVGTTILRVTSSIVKAANPAVDVGYSRAYTVTIEGELPADASLDAGLRDVEVNVSLSASRQKTVTMRGVYTATSAGTALARYTAAFDARAEDFLTLIDSGATWELVGESYTLDRETDGSGDPSPHTVGFTRQYVELLENQSAAALNDTDIRDHRVTFTDLSSYPGDSAENLIRLHRVVASYDCAVDVDQTTNLQTVFTDKVRPHLVALFETNFTPQVFGVEEQRVSYDETSNRMSVSMVIVYKAEGGEQIVEVQQSMTIRETRTIDYTPVHGSNELAAHADVGWATKERIWNRTAIVLGDVAPGERLSRSRGPSKGGANAASFTQEIGGVAGPDSGGGAGPSAIGGIAAGWNTIASTSQATPGWIGVPGLGQIAISTITESVVERYHEVP